MITPKIRFQKLIAESNIERVMEQKNASNLFMFWGRRKGCIGGADQMCSE